MLEMVLPNQKPRDSSDVFYIFEVCSSPVDVPEIKYGYLVGNACDNTKWNWLDISSPITKCSEKVNIMSTLFKPFGLGYHE